MYTLRDEVHLVRLSEGTDTLLERGSAARFVDTGLVYVTNVDDAAYPTRIVFIPDGELPD